jgi:8-oxo-dGTP pyrophosphatase MutT (NUDIX family)
MRPTLPHEVVLQGPRLEPFEMKDRTLVQRHSVFGVERHGLYQRGVKLRDVDTFEMRDWCNVVAVTPDDQLVLVWQWRYGTQRFSLETPGGVIDEGESPLEAARRELLEETGYEGSFAPLIENHPNPALQGNRCFSFLATNAKRVRDPGGGDPDEQLSLEIVPAEFALRLCLEGHVRHCICQMALAAYHARRS